MFAIRRIDVGATDKTHRLGVECQRHELLPRFVAQPAGE